MEIKPLDLTVKQLLEKSFYKIPRFQRPYSWDQGNVEDFWKDAVMADEPDYFIGSFVLYEDAVDPDLLYIVDGQQRLTTITLLLAAIREQLDDIELSALAVSLHKLIEREDINGELRFVLDSETPYPYLQENIQKHAEVTSPGTVGREQLALKKAYDYLSQQISQALSAIELDSTLSEEARAKEKREKLQDIRDRILRLQLISVQLDNEDNAYLIFETLNTRGKDLTVSDLVKNHLTRLLKPSNKGVDRAKDRWNEILELFDKSEIDISVNRFLHHSWLTRAPYTTEKKLFKEIKRSIVKQNAEQYLDALVRDAAIYRQILEPEGHSWTKQERPLDRALRALNVFRVMQPVPMMLSILRAYRNKDLTLKQTKNVMHAMENFHVQFTGVTSQRTGGGTALMYASAARQLQEAKGTDGRQSVLREFVEKLRERVPSYEEFEAAFSEVEFTDNNTKQRALVRYMLLRIDRHLRSGTAPDYDDFTIEHIAAQNPAEKPECSEQYVGWLGNLILIPDGLNGKLKNRSVEEKLSILRKSDVPLDETLQSVDGWSDDIIQKRTKHLATLCYDKIFKV